MTTMSEPHLEIVPYDPSWPGAFAAEADRLRAALGGIALRIDHHGSTSVPGLAAKPILDVQISVTQVRPMDPYRDPLFTLGYLHLPHADDVFCPFFYRPHEWPHTHHVHVVEAGGAEERRTLAFRDYLRDHPDVARDYERLKQDLARRCSATAFETQQAYADAKGDFIERVIAQAFAAGYPHGHRRVRRKWRPILIAPATACTMEVGPPFTAPKEPVMSVETVSHAVDRLTAGGYRDDFRAEVDGLRAVHAGCVHPPESLIINEVVRFEGITDPDDEAIVFALRCEPHGVTGTYATSYGAGMAALDADMVRRLSAPA
jgi:GrpB-like predicted nucleotidyltransferase (UPF0157 family)